MISFIWPSKTRLPAGTGGSENYTIGQVRELILRGIPAQVVTIGLGTKDGRSDFVDIPFKSLSSEKKIATLDGTVVFVNRTSNVKTKLPAFVIMHIPPPVHTNKRATRIKLNKGLSLITTSKYAARHWASYLGLAINDVHIAYPFAEPCFATIVRPPYKKKAVRILFAGRLSAQKGIYTFLEMLHLDIIDRNHNLVFTVTTAGSDKPEGKIIQLLVNAHPNLTVVQKRKTPVAMAELMAVQDIIVMPSNSQYWHETFGIVSIEAQHSGCRVVASNDGGLPETNCGGVILVKPDDAQALAQGIYQAIDKGPLPFKLRARSANFFTLEQSVDNLLKVLFPSEELVVHPVEKVILKSSVKMVHLS